MAELILDKPNTPNRTAPQSNVEIRLAQGPYEPNAGLIAGETTDDSADQSQPSTNESRLSTACSRTWCAIGGSLFIVSRF